VSVVYDAGVHVAADRGDRQVWADHRVRLEVGLVPVTTAPVVAQVSRSGRQAQLRRLLRGCEVVPLSDDDAHAVGALLGRAKTADVVDAHLVHTAAARGLGVLTGDPDDIARLASHMPRAVRVYALSRYQ
jgi:predicted nucleic acid-binding protein